MLGRYYITVSNQDRVQEVENNIQVCITLSALNRLQYGRCRCARVPVIIDSLHSVEKKTFLGYILVGRKPLRLVP